MNPILYQRMFFTDCKFRILKELTSLGILKSKTSQYEYLEAPRDENLFHLNTTKTSKIYSEMTFIKNVAINESSH